MSWKCLDDVATFKMRCNISILLSRHCCSVLIVSVDVATLLLNVEATF